MTAAKYRFQECGCVRGVVQLHEMACNMYTGRGKATEELRTRIELRKVYCDAEWKYEEVTTLFSIADLMLQVRKPKEAIVKVAKEAMELSRSMQDTEIEATAMLSLARIQFACGAATDALAATSSA